MRKVDDLFKINRREFYCLDDKRNNALNCFSRINSDIEQLVSLIELSTATDKLSMSKTIMLIKYLLLTLKEALKFIAHVIENESLKSLIPNESNEILNELTNEIQDPAIALDSFNSRVLTKVRDDIAHYSTDNKQVRRNNLLINELVNQDKNILFTKINQQIDFELFTDILFINNINEIERKEMLILADKIRLLSKQVLKNHIVKYMKS